MLSRVFNKCSIARSLVKVAVIKLSAVVITRVVVILVVETVVIAAAVVVVIVFIVHLGVRVLCAQQSRSHRRRKI
jgi:hypothetical protein